MSIRLYVIHNSHPCDAAARALELKGLAYKVTEWPVTAQVLIQPLLFGGRTVPAMTLDGEKIQGSTEIFHRLDELVPEPALYPADRRAAVEAADRWGNDFQQVARDILFPAAKATPEVLVQYTAGSRIPMPAALVKRIAPALIALEHRLQHTDVAKARRRLAELPDQIAQIDGWIAEGVMGDPDHPNAADLQILSTIRLLNTVGDCRALMAHSPAPALADRLFGGPIAADIPAGALA